MSPAPNRAANAAHILIVDDEPMVLMSLREMLRPEGYSLMTAAGPEEALRAVQGQPFALVISDQQMPGMNGVELLAEIKRLSPETVRVLVSALPTAELALDAINKAEIFRFIVKPWQRKPLLEIVREAVACHEKVARHRARLTTTTAMNDTLTRLTKSLQTQLEEERARKR